MPSNFSFFIASLWGSAEGPSANVGELPTVRRFEPGTSGLEALILPLCYADPSSPIR